MDELRIGTRVDDWMSDVGHKENECPVYVR
jgi:hypothetical protein